MKIFKCNKVVDMALIFSMFIAMAHLQLPAAKERWGAMGACRLTRRHWSCPRKGEAPAWGSMASHSLPPLINTSAFVLTWGSLRPAGKMHLNFKVKPEKRSTQRELAVMD